MYNESNFAAMLAKQLKADGNESFYSDLMYTLHYAAICLFKRDRWGERSAIHLMTIADLATLLEEKKESPLASRILNRMHRLPFAGEVWTSKYKTVIILQRFTDAECTKAIYMDGGQIKIFTEKTWDFLEDFERTGYYSKGALLFRDDLAKLFPSRELLTYQRFVPDGVCLDTIPENSNAITLPFAELGQIWKCNDRGRTGVIIPAKDGCDACIQYVFCDYDDAVTAKDYSVEYFKDGHHDKGMWSHAFPYLVKDLRKLENIVYYPVKQGKQDAPDDLRNRICAMCIYLLREYTEDNWCRNYLYYNCSVTLASLLDMIGYHEIAAQYGALATCQYQTAIQERL